MTIQEFKNAEYTKAKTFDYGGIRGVTYECCGLYVYECETKLTGERDTTFWIDSGMSKIPLTEQQFLEHIN
jgi:hypothetical protein